MKSFTKKAFVSLTEKFSDENYLLENKKLFFCFIHERSWNNETAGFSLIGSFMQSRLDMRKMLMRKLKLTWHEAEAYVRIFLNEM